MEAEKSCDESMEKCKVCAVCGDKALGHNFNAVTCESCKAFFRRNALKDKEFKCPFNNECEVTVITRRFCQKCRLKRCFEVGMKKEYILSEEAKHQKKIKIEENRVRKYQRQLNRKSSSLLETDSCSPAATNESSGGPTSPQNNISLSPSELGGNMGNDLILMSSRRPQARVLPSARSKSEEGEINPAKMPRKSKQQATFHQLLVQPESPGSFSGANSRNFSSTTVGQFQNHQRQVPQAAAFENESQSTSNQSNSSISTSAPAADQFNLANQSFQLQDASSSLGEWTFDNLDDIVAVAIKAEFHTFELTDMATTSNEAHQPNVSACSESQLKVEQPEAQQIPMGLTQLNDQERARLDELFVASRSLVEPMELERDQLYSQAEPNNLISVINLTDLAIKRIIRMTKKITPFANMCIADQIALLKGGCTELMILRSVLNYDPDKNSWRLPSKDRPRELRLEVLKEASQLGVNLYEEHQRFVKSFEPQWRSDENVMLLLSAIALFTPERCNVVHKDVIKLEQDTYYYLLRRYLETVYSGCEPRRAYLGLIGKLQDLHRLNESHIQVFLEVNPKLIEPLLIEIFDLNPQRQ